MNSIPLVFRYRGTLQDTAVLVGLRNVKVRLDHIVYQGENSFLLRRYLLTLNRWLEEQCLPSVSLNQEPLPRGLPISTENTLSAWGWEDKVCAAAIRLAGLPLPPDPAKLCA